MFNYEIFIHRVSDWLQEHYSEITTSTDIIEHAFLRLLGYQFVPEKCLIDDANGYLRISLSTPYKLTEHEFISDLQICATGEFSGIHIQEADQNSEFAVQLHIPYSLIQNHISGLLSSIKYVLVNI